MDSCGEHDEFDLTITMYDTSGVLAAPTSATYRIDDVKSATQIRDDTALSAAATQTIQVKYADTAMVDAANEAERRRLTVTAIFGTDDAGNPRQITREYDFVVANSRFT
jgi:hypothetical protein